LARLAPARVSSTTTISRSRPGLLEALAGPQPWVRRAPRALAERSSTPPGSRWRRASASSTLLLPEPDRRPRRGLGRGVRIFFVGIRPGFRLPLEAYYAYLALKNGVPVAYGGGWALFGTLDFAINIFASFRQGSRCSSRRSSCASTGGSRHATIVVDRYQLGHESAEALQSGSFYFYHRLGFRPRRPEILRVLEAERARIAADPGIASPVPVLKRLAGDEVFLTLPRRSGAGEETARDRRGDAGRALRGAGVRRRPAAATRESARHVARALGVRGVAGWPVEERRAFEHLSLVAALVPDLARWPFVRRGRARRPDASQGRGIRAGVCAPPGPPPPLYRALRRLAQS